MLFSFEGGRSTLKRAFVWVSLFGSFCHLVFCSPLFFFRCLRRSGFLHVISLGISNTVTFGLWRVGALTSRGTVPKCGACTDSLTTENAGSTRLDLPQLGPHPHGWMRHELFHPYGWMKDSPESLIGEVLVQGSRDAFRLFRITRSGGIQPVRVMGATRWNHLGHWC